MNKNKLAVAKAAVVLGALLYMEISHEIRVSRKIRTHKQFNEIIKFNYPTAKV